MYLVLLNLNLRQRISYVRTSTCTSVFVITVACLIKVMKSAFTAAVACDLRPITRHSCAKSRPKVGICVFVLTGKQALLKRNFNLKKIGKGRKKA